MRHTIRLALLLASFAFAAVAAFAAGSGSGNAPDRRPLRVAAAGALDPFDADLLATFAWTQGRSLLPVIGAPAVVASGGADVAVGLYADAVASGELAPTQEVLPSRLVALSRRPGARAGAPRGLRR